MQPPPCSICEANLPLKTVLTHLVRCLGIPVTVNVAAFSAPQSEPLRLAEGIQFDPTGFRLTVCGEPLWLTAKEGRLLGLLLRNKGMILSRDQILDAVWGFDTTVSIREVDCYIGRLRRKLGVHPKGREVIQTVRDAGYRLIPLSD
jgi:DNA-binding response OmpR family regulator